MAALLLTPIAVEWGCIILGLVGRRPGDSARSRVPDKETEHRFGNTSLPPRPTVWASSSRDAQAGQQGVAQAGDLLELIPDLSTEAVPADADRLWPVH